MKRTNYFYNILPKDTLSYTYINNENIDKQDLQSTNIIGCTIENSNFAEVNFNSADFDGSILINCEFMYGDWSRTDCCSLTASNTIFVGIDFTLSTMRNCDFKKCSFVNCKFDHIALSGSCFEECEFTNIHIRQSSTYLNSYIRCSFEECDINGNFYYNLMIHNSYIASSFESKLFAYNYFVGSDRNNFEILGLDAEQKQDLDNYLKCNKLLINLVILKLNATNDIDIAIIQFIVAIGEILKMELLIREEQLQFIHNFLQWLLKNELISAVTIAEVLSCLEKSLQFFDSQHNFAYQKCEGTINSIKNELFQAYQIMGQSISCMYDKEKEDMIKMVKIVYEEEPQIPICTILNEIKVSLGINAPDAVRVKTETGSFHEWISCYDSVLQCLQLFVEVLSLGYAIVSDRRKKIDNKIENHTEGEETTITTSEQMIALLNKALSKQKINPEFSQAIQIVVKNDIIATKKFRGYSRSNIQSIEIITKNN